MSVRIGIAGIGFMGMVHYLAYQQIAGASVAALCSRNRARLEGDWRGIRGNFGPAGKQVNLRGVSKYTRLEDLLRDDQIDLIDITLPPDLHTSTAIRAFEHGKHVFCEKPLALSVSECRRIVQAAKRAKRHLFVGHVLPYFSEYEWALQTVREGKYGKLLGASFKREIVAPAWVKKFWQADKVGGPMYDLHVHDAHFIRLLFGMPQAVVSCGSTYRGLPKHWHSLLSFKDRGFAVHASGGVVDNQGRSFCHGFEIRLQRAMLKFEFAVVRGEGKYLCEPTIENARGKVTVVNLKGRDPMDAFRAELSEVVRCVAADIPSETLGGDAALDAVTICHQQTASMTSGRPERF